MLAGRAPSDTGKIMISPVLCAVLHSPAHNTDLMIAARVIVVLSKDPSCVPASMASAHVGRPDGERNENLNLCPTMSCLSQLLTGWLLACTAVLSGQHAHRNSLGMRGDSLV